MSERGESSAGWRALSNPQDQSSQAGVGFFFCFFSFLTSWWAGLSALRWPVHLQLHARAGRAEHAATSAKRRAPKSHRPLGYPNEDEDEDEDERARMRPDKCCAVLSALLHAHS